jgi:pilus assembly protein HofM
MRDGWQVTAAQRLDIDVLRQLAARLKLRIAAIVPDASALAHFPLATPVRKAWHGATILIGCGQPGRAGAVCRALASSFTTLPADRWSITPTAPPVLTMRPL